CYCYTCNISKSNGSRQFCCQSLEARNLAGVTVPAVMPADNGQAVLEILKRPDAQPKCQKDAGTYKPNNQQRQVRTADRDCEENNFFQKIYDRAKYILNTFINRGTRHEGWNANFLWHCYRPIRQMSEISRVEHSRIASQCDVHHH